MSRPIKWGLILGAAITLLTLVFAVAGWQSNYNLAFVWLALAIGINTVVIVLCLRETASDRAWAGQLGAGLLVGLVGSVIIFVATWFITGVAFPDYYLDMAEGYRTTFEASAMSPSDIETSVAQLAGTSAVRSSFEAVAGTMAVSAIASAVTAIWVRKKA